jgi:hypothetical protein
MSGLNVLGYAISALISALVAILLTGKINSSLADRATARKLRLRASRVLLAGSGREQSGWWYVSAETLDDISARLVALGEDAATVSAGAAQAFGHAAQMLPVLLRARELYKESIASLSRARNKYMVPDANVLRMEEIKAELGLRTIYGVIDEENHPDVLRARDAVQTAIRNRDDALSAVAIIYRDLLKADSLLAKVGRWLRVIDPRAEPEPPEPYRTALRYAEDHLHGADIWDEPSEATLEAMRVSGIATQAPVGTGFEEIDQAIVRQNIASGEPLVINDPRYGGHQ